MRISGIVPTLDEAAPLGATLASAREEADELIVVDGGSRDGTAELAAAREPA